jgi:hypothetical protein
VEATFTIAPPTAASRGLAAAQTRIMPTRLTATTSAKISGSYSLSGGIDHHIELIETADGGLHRPAVAHIEGREKNALIGGMISCLLNVVFVRAGGCHRRSQIAECERRTKADAGGSPGYENMFISKQVTRIRF